MFAQQLTAYRLSRRRYDQLYTIDHSAFVTDLKTEMFCRAYRLYRTFQSLSVNRTETVTSSCRELSETLYLRNGARLTVTMEG